jgi:hypothetical protein
VPLPLLRTHGVFVFVDLQLALLASTRSARERQRTALWRGALSPAQTVQQARCRVPATTGAVPRW